MNAPHLDYNMNGGIRPGNFLVIVGWTGSGKSMMAVHLGKMAARFGSSVVHASSEMAEEQVRDRYLQSFGGVTVEQLSSLPVRIQEKAGDAIIKHADIHIINDEEQTRSIVTIIDAVDRQEDKSGKKVSLIIVDSPDDYGPPPGRHDGEQEKNTAVYQYLANIAKSRDLAIIGTTQSNRKGGEKYWIDKQHVAWNIGKLQKATHGLSINVTPEESKKGYARVWLFKSRDSREGMRLWIKRDLSRAQTCLQSGRYILDIYDEMIDKANEIFGGEDDVRNK